ncbi:uncharacterized protein LOC122363514 isoform X1 [Amphibalanus amphitrite]|uniref:uncharacterized protein LOC122363514 isoform X1 n=2 Tax=Amphibalanus amphitrite TaxID=1232801 RepID=UPI001C910B7A|nr:uncharacterized protein LOC122363514 isoform X1 [Amphibalanus amphitrite]XP_043188843.1 uncharacterized protein LOC122363514 isoform X1 [Amphibalanus amphitrite]
MPGSLKALTSQAKAMNEENVEGATEVESAFEALTKPGPLCQEELKDQTDDLELWIVRAPAQVNISELRNCKLPLSEGRVTRSDTLELTAEAYVPEGLHVLLPNRKGKKLKMVPVPLAGQVLVHRRLDAPAADPASAPVTSAVPEPPEAGPDRHPLLGVGYRETLKRCSEALALSNSLGSRHASPKKKKSSKPTASEPTPDTGKKKRKKLH